MIHFPLRGQERRGALAGQRRGQEKIGEERRGYLKPDGVVRCAQLICRTNFVARGQLGVGWS